MTTYEILESTSELRIRVYGQSLSDLFKNALKGMFESIEPVVRSDAAQVFHWIEIQAPDREILLVSFLSEALFFSDANNEAFFDVTFDQISPKGLRAQIMGKKVDGFAIEIKAVTYHDVHIQEKNGRLTTELLFDI